MISDNYLKIITTGVLAVNLSGCGTHVPQMEEAWEPVELPYNMEFRIKDRIFCETVRALREMRDPKHITTVKGKYAVPDDYGVQMQVTLAAEENTSFNPGVSFNKTYRNSTVGGVNVMNMFNLGLGANLTSTATRTDTLYSYYNVGRILQGNEDCDTPKPQHGSSLLLQSDLGIRDFLNGSAVAAAYSSSSPVPKDKKDVKADIYSYDIKFAVVTNGNVSPTWKLVNVSADTGTSPLLGAGRTRTHELVLTFGPGKTRPTEEALQTHFTGQIVQQLNRLERTLQ